MLTAAIIGAHATLEDCYTRVRLAIEDGQLLLPPSPSQLVHERVDGGATSIAWNFARFPILKRAYRPAHCRLSRA
jgi:hypothetical protein